MIELFYEKTTDPNRERYFPGTALIYAAIANRIDTVKQLLAPGVVKKHGR